MGWGDLDLPAGSEAGLYTRKVDSPDAGPGSLRAARSQTPLEGADLRPRREEVFSRRQQLSQ